MGNVTETGNVTIPGGVSGSVGNSHAGHGDSARAGTPPSFSASYALALEKASAYRGAPSEAPHAHALPATDPGTASNTAGGSHSSSSANGSTHIPLAGQQEHGTGSHDLHEKALGLRAYRQQILASNIANADTPGYKAVDIDLQKALREAQQTEPMRLATTTKGHISAPTGSSFPGIALEYHVPSQQSVDGNTVEMDVERTKFAENAVMYEFELDRAIGHYKHMIEMMQSLKD